MRTTTRVDRRSRVVTRGLWSALVVSVLAPSLVLGSPGVVYATGGSITSPGAIAAAEAAGVSEAEWLAFLAGHAELTGASVAAPVASTVATAAATAAGATVASPGLLGKVTGLLGGIGDWLFGAPESPTALPSGTGGGSWTGAASAVWAKYGAASPVTVTGTITLPIVWSATLYNGTPVEGWATGLTHSGLSSPNTSGTACSSTNGLYCTSTNNATSITRQQKCWSNSGHTVTPNDDWSAVPSSFSSMSLPWSPYPATSLFKASGGACTYGVYAFRITLTESAAAGGAAVSRVFKPTDPAAPQRHIEQTITCKNAAGVTQTYTSSTAAALWEPSEMVEVAGLMCPLGERAVGVTATVKTEGGADLVVVNEPYIEGTGWDAATSNIPEPCYSGTTCHLELERVTGADTWEQVDPATVPDWWGDPARDITYRCVYGAGATWAVLSLSACEVYKTPTVGIAQPTNNPSSDPAPSDPSGDCSFGWLDLLNGGIFIRGSKCVVRWAFTPTPGTVDTLYAQVQARAPFSVALAGFDGAQAMVTAYNGAGSCGSIADFTSDDIDGLIECDAFSKIPGASALRALVGVVLVSLTALSVVNMATARFSGGAT